MVCRGGKFLCHVWTAIIVHILSPETDNNCSSQISGRENDRRKHFMIDLHERMLPTMFVSVDVSISDIERPYRSSQVNFKVSLLCTD